MTTFSSRHDDFDSWGGEPVKLACFSAQQSAEKAVKAVLYRRGAEAWGHSVAGLLAALDESIPVADELREAALQLDKAYIASRYPDAHPSGSPSTRYTRKEAERMVAYAGEIVRFCESCLSPSQP